MASNGESPALAGMTCEEVTMKALGEWGRWQMSLIGCLILFRAILLGALSAIVFLGAPQPFACLKPPADPGSCVHCDQWSHETKLFRATVVTEWDLVCERNHLVSLVQTSFMLAAMVGSIGVSTLADRYGRKVVLAGGGLVMGIAGCCAGLVGSYWTFITLRFIQGMAVGATIALTQVYCVEILGPKGRSKFSLMVNLFAYLILIAFSGLAYITSHWRLYQIITTAPAILSVTFFWILPESPRWLIAVDRLDDALAVLQTAARWNDNPIPKYLPPKPKSEISEKTTEYSPLDLIRTSSMRRLTFITGFNFFSNGYCHYGIQQYLSHIRGNVFVNATLAAVFGLSGAVLALLLTNKFGRRVSLCTGQFIVTAAYFTFIFLPEVDWMVWVKVCVGASGVVGTSTCFSTTYLYSSELFPTVIRNTAMGTINTCARVGAMIAPFIVALNSTFPQVPPVLFGCLSLIAGLSVLGLPETRGVPLPETFDDVKIMRRNVRLWRK